MSAPSIHPDSPYYDVLMAFRQHLRVAGLAEGTRHNYMRAALALLMWIGKRVPEITEQDISDYFHYLTFEKKVARTTHTVALCAARLLFADVVRRENWLTLEIARPLRQRRLPVVLTKEEVRRILAKVKMPMYRTCLKLIYTCGLRITEGTQVRVSDIDGERRLLFVHGKRAKDRYVPMSEAVLDELRQVWLGHRCMGWIFPSSQSVTVVQGNKNEDGIQPVPASTILAAFKAALKASRVTKNASVRTLRHSYATHLTETGTSLQVIQRLLGHNSPRTTTIYSHITDVAMRPAIDEINRMGADL